MTVHLSADMVRWLRLRAQGLAGATGSPADVVRRLVGVQAQEPAAAALSIRARGLAVTAGQVQQAIEDSRSLIRAWFMRGTLHLVAAEDVGWLLAHFAPVFIRQGSRRRAELGLDEATAARGVALLQTVLAGQRPQTRAEVVAQLAQHGLRLVGQAAPHLLGLAALQAIICYGPEREGEPTYVLLDEWTSRHRQRPADASLKELARRYLAAYGPARPEDLAAWSGLPLRELRQAWQAITGELMEVQVEGETAWLPSARAGWLDERPPEQPIVRLLPRYDTYLLGYRDRSLIVAPEYGRRVNAGGGVIHPTVLVNGWVVGTWQVKRPRGRVEVVVEPFGNMDMESYRAELDEEVERVGRFLEGRQT